MKEIHAFHKVDPQRHLIIVRDDELQSIRKKSKEHFAHLPENNTNRAILSLSCSSEEAGALRIVAARDGKSLSAWLRSAAIFFAYLNLMEPRPNVSDASIELKAGELLGYFID